MGALTLYSKMGVRCHCELDTFALRRVLSSSGQGITFPPFSFFFEFVKKKSRFTFTLLLYFLWYSTNRNNQNVRKIYRTWYNTKNIVNQHFCKSEPSWNMLWAENEQLFKVITEYNENKISKIWKETWYTYNRLQPTTNRLASTK